MKEEPPESPPPPPPRKRMSWLRREGIDLGDAAVQFVSVVVGIVLGLLITQWVTHRQQQHAVHEAMHAIRAELIANRAALRKNAVRWYEEAAKLKGAPENQNQPPRPCYMLKYWSGYGSAVVTDAAYQTAITTQALAHMPFKQAHLLALVYGHQHRYAKDFNFLEQHFLFAGPKPLNLCIDIVIGLGHHDQVLARQYAPLIGPIKAKWPVKPSKLQLQRNTSK